MYVYVCMTFPRTNQKQFIECHYKDNLFYHIYGCIIIYMYYYIYLLI